jgi:hypothetical protein
MVNLLDKINSIDLFWSQNPHIQVPHLEGDAWWSLFNEARKNVRSLLLSTKTGLTTIDIMRDYGSFICKG